MEQLREWLARKKGGDNFLVSVEELPWLADESKDLLAVTREPFDAFTGWVAESVIPWLTKGRQKVPLIKKVALAYLRFLSMKADLPTVPHSRTRRTWTPRPSRSKIPKSFASGRRLLLGPHAFIGHPHSVLHSKYAC